jgi:hypothetical protein
MLNHGLNHGLFLSLFKFFWMKIHSKLKSETKKKLDCYIISDFRFLLEIQAILPTVGPAVEPSPKRKSWLVLLWQTFRLGKDIEH